MVVLRSAIQIPAQTFCSSSFVRSDSRPQTPASVRTPATPRAFNEAATPRAFNEAATITTPDKPSICTADELHYVSVHNSDWRLALWRYKPPLKAPRRNHPLFLLSGLATNAIGFDLSPGSSFARYMSSQGFDTWILEFRGAGLSTGGVISAEVKKPINCASSINQTPNENSNAVSEREVFPAGDKSWLVTKLTGTIMSFSERFSGWLDEGLSEAGQNSFIANQIRDLSQRLVSVIEEGQQSISPQFIDMQDRIFTTIEDFQKEVDKIVKYDWDFDHYLEEDVPIAMEYVRTHCKPKDGKLLALGHSMGGMLLYAMLSQNGFEGKDSGLASVITVASSLDYTTTRSSFKLLLPLADPAQTLNVRVIPVGVLLAAAYPLASRPPYVLSWLNPLVSAQDLHLELFEKLVSNNFCTVPAKLLLQLSTAFREGGLCDRNRSFFYKDHLHKSSVPVLAIAGDRDLVCPPEAVFETVKLFPKNLVSYKVFGELSGPHYAHYDLVGGPEAADQVYPVIIKFLIHHDRV